MILSEYIMTHVFKEGTVLQHTDISTIKKVPEGWLHIQGGILSDDECKRVFQTVAEWLNTLPVLNPEDDYPINIILNNDNNEEPVHPAYAIHMPYTATPNQIVKAILEKNNVTFRVKTAPSLNMIYARTKISRLELESEESWCQTKLRSPDTWASEYAKRTSILIDAYNNIKTASTDPDKMVYTIHNPKYPRVYIKMGKVMKPIYNISDGSDYIFVDGTVGKTWAYFGIIKKGQEQGQEQEQEQGQEPEFWVSWRGTLQKQDILYYEPQKSYISS
jgi:hypothetical protein